MRPIPVEGGRDLETIRLRFEDLPAHAGKHGDAYLRVIVELDAPVLSLFDQVREVLPNALDVTPALAVTPGEPGRVDDGTALTPGELLGRFYAERNSGAAIPEGLLKLFNELYEVEAARAPE